MKTFSRVCITDHTITDDNSTSFTIKRGKEYITSPEKDGTVMVFSQYWVRVSVNIFAGAIPGPGTPHETIRS